MDEHFSRRAFLKRTAALTGALAVAPHSRVLGASDDIRVAVIGVGNKGSQHVGVFKKLPGVRVVALCDPDSTRLNRAVEKHFKEAGTKPKTYTDVRKLLDDKEIDAVCVATPNHWHGLATVWACQAGKDVYTEKPFSHAFREGQQMIAAAEKYGRIVQVGTQSRSDPGLQAARKYILDGNIGELEFIRGLHYRLREPIGKVDGPQQPPPGVDYNMWLGPAPKAPLMREKLHYDWHWQWPYGNGELGDNMVHMLDIAMWFSGIKEFPKRVMSVGGRFKWDDDGETPNTQTVFYDYDPVPVVCDLQTLPRKKDGKAAGNLHGQRAGVQVKCRDGFYVGYRTGGWVYDNKGERVKQFKGDGGKSHHQNFIDAVRARKPEILTANAEAGHLSAGLCHIGNISHKLGEPANGAAIQEATGGVQLLEEMIDEFNEHLLVNAVDVNQYPRQLGPWLDFNPKSQRFTGERADEANAHLETAYREGFEFPELA